MDCNCSYAYFSSYNSVFQRKMQLLLRKVRAQIANMNSFVQRQVTGMKIVQLFTRVIEADKFQIIITNTKKSGLKPFFTTPSLSLLISFHR
jgi:ABC-type multidrug transport system fused ATPase/permease subunit